MLFKMDVGAELDIATSDELENLGNSVVDRLKSEPVQQPRYFSVPFSGASASSAATPFELFTQYATPPKNHCWELFGITVTGSDDHTSVAGTVAMYFGNATNPSLIDLKIPVLAIPSYTPIGSRRFFVVPGMSIYLMVAGVPNNQVINVNVHVSEERIKDKMASGLM